MIIKGGSRRAGGFFGKHLMNAEDNERVAVTEIRGFTSETVPDIFREISVIAAGTQARNPFYHVSISPRAEEHLTEEQWQTSVDRLEHNLGLDGHDRFIVEHEKPDSSGTNRVHRHIVWNRIDPETMTVVSDSFTYQAHDKTRLELEQEFSHEPTTPTPQPSQRKSREIADWENFRAAESGISPAEMKAEITELWQQSDSGRAFQAAIEEKGYLLAKGDRRDFVLIDPEGDIHSLARRIDGAKAADIRAKMGDLDRDSLMGAKEASAWIQAKEGEAENSGSSDARILPQEQAQEVTNETVEPSHNPKLAVLEKYATQQSELGHSTAQEFTDQQEAVLVRQGWQLPYLGTQTVDGWLQRGYESLEEQHAAIPEAQHHPPNKQPHESWSEFVTRTAESKRTEEKEREPEIEL